MIEPEAKHAVGRLVERLRPFVARRLSSPADVDDVLQDVLLRMHGHLGELRDHDRFGPWIYRIVRNAIVDRHRAAARDARPPVEAPPEVEPDPDEGATGELAHCVAPFVARLPSPYREAVTLVDLEGVTLKAAAAMAGVTLPGMKSRVQRGRARLRALFEACCRLELDARQRVVAYECAPGESKGCGCRPSS
jgi:RNA polymerase sigma-70 factor, ECF subfamily